MLLKFLLLLVDFILEIIGGGIFLSNDFRSELIAHFIDTVLNVGFPLIFKFII